MGTILERSKRINLVTSLADPSLSIKNLNMLLVKPIDDQSVNYNEILRRRSSNVGVIATYFRNDCIGVGQQAMSPKISGQRVFFSVGLMKNFGFQQDLQSDHFFAIRTVTVKDQLIL